MSRRSNIRVRSNNKNRHRRVVRPPRQRRRHLEKNTDMFRFRKAFNRLGMKRFINHPFYKKVIQNIITPSSINRR